MTNSNQTTQNEIVTNEETATQTPEIMAQNVVSETAEYVVLKDENGKFVRKAKFADYSSVVAESRADKIWLMNVLDGDEESGNGLKSHVGKIIEIADVITRKYDKINPDTGVTEYGVLTYLITPGEGDERVAYATSSKTVYFSITRLMKTFGHPGSPEWENIKVKVTSKKATNGDAINIKMVG